MRMSSVFRGGSVALGLAAAIAFTGSVIAQTQSQQNSSTGCYSGPESEAAKFAAGCGPLPGSAPPAAPAAQPAGKAGPYSGSESDAAKNAAGCAAPPGTASSPQDLAKALQASGPGAYSGTDCTAATKAAQ